MTVRTTTSQTSRIGTTVEDGWLESSRLGLARTLVENVPYRRQQLPDADRLSLETVEPSGHHSRSVLGHYRRRDGDDRRVMRHWISSQALQGFQAADARQLNVHQDQGRVALVGEADALFTRLGFDGLVSLDL